MNLKYLTDKLLKHMTKIFESGGPEQLSFEDKLYKSIKIYSLILISIFLFDMVLSTFISYFIVNLLDNKQIVSKNKLYFIAIINYLAIPTLSWPICPNPSDLSASKRSRWDPRRHEWEARW